MSDIVDKSEILHELTNITEGLEYIDISGQRAGNWPQVMISSPVIYEQHNITFVANDGGYATFALKANKLYFCMARITSAGWQTAQYDLTFSENVAGGGWGAIPKTHVKGGNANALSETIITQMLRKNTSDWKLGITYGDGTAQLAYLRITIYEILTKNTKI